MTELMHPFKHFHAIVVHPPEALRPQMGVFLFLRKRNKNILAIKEYSYSVLSFKAIFGRNFLESIDEFINSVILFFNFNAIDIILVLNLLLLCALYYLYSYIVMVIVQGRW